MEFNPLFFQKGSELGGDQILGKPQGLKNAGYLFSDLMKVHMNETTDGLLENIQQSFLGKDFLNVESGDQATLGVIENITLSPNDAVAITNDIQNLLANAGSIDIADFSTQLKELLSAETDVDQSSVDKLLQTIKKELDTKGTVVLSFPSAGGIALISIAVPKQTEDAGTIDVSNSTLNVNAVKVSASELPELNGLLSQQTVEELIPATKNKAETIFILGLQPVEASEVAEINLTNPELSKNVQPNGQINAPTESAARSTNLTEVPVFTEEPDISVTSSIGKEAAKVEDLKTLQSKFSNELVSAKVLNKENHPNILSSTPESEGTELSSPEIKTVGKREIPKQSIANNPSDNKQTKTANANNTATIQPTAENMVEETANTLAGIPKGKPTGENNIFTRQPLNNVSDVKVKTEAQSVQPETVLEKSTVEHVAKNNAAKTTLPPNQNSATKQTTTEKQTTVESKNVQSPVINDSKESAENATQNLTGSAARKATAQSQINKSEKSVPDLNAKTANKNEQTTGTENSKANGDTQNKATAEKLTTEQLAANKTKNINAAKTVVAESKTNTENQSVESGKLTEKTSVESGVAQSANKQGNKTTEQSVAANESKNINAEKTAVAESKTNTENQSVESGKLTEKTSVESGAAQSANKQGNKTTEQSVAANESKNINAEKTAVAESKTNTENQSVESGKHPGKNNSQKTVNSEKNFSPSGTTNQSQTAEPEIEILKATEKTNDGLKGKESVKDNSPSPQIFSVKENSGEKQSNVNGKRVNNETAEKQTARYENKSDKQPLSESATVNDSNKKSETQKTENQNKTVEQNTIQTAAAEVSDKKGKTAEFTVKNENPNTTSQTAATNGEDKNQIKPQSEASSQNANRDDSEEEKALRQKGEIKERDTKSISTFNHKEAESVEAMRSRETITKTVKVSEIIKELSTLIQKKEKSQITLQLNPESLGKVKVVIEVIDDIVKAHIKVENQAVQHTLQNNVAELSTHLERAGLQFGGMNISLYDPQEKESKQSYSKRKHNSNNAKEEAPEEGKGDTVRSLGYNTYEYLA